MTKPIVTAASAMLLFAAGCATYAPAPPPISRLSPDQLAAIRANTPLSDAQKQRLSEQNQQVLREQDEADARIAEALRRQQARAYAVDPWYGYPGWSPGYGYYAPYPAYTPFYPGLSLSLGYVWGRSHSRSHSHRPHRHWRGHR